MLGAPEKVAYNFKTLVWFEWLKNTILSNSVYLFDMKNISLLTKFKWGWLVLRNVSKRSFKILLES